MNAGTYIKNSGKAIPGKSNVYSLLKRLLDLFVAGAVFLLLFPLIFLIYMALYLSNKGRPLFIQERVGKDERIFPLIKFRTMSEEKDEHGKLLPDADRLTVVGSFLRKTSLDELPQLVNVMKGDMSLVGPRPLLPKYLPRYSQQQARRHQVKPGITGWAQINGRNAVPWPQRLEMDVYYVDNQSFLLDLKILLATIRKVFLQDGISSNTSATMEEFLG